MPGEVQGGTRLAAARQRTQALAAQVASDGAKLPTADLVRIWEGRRRPFWILYPSLYEELAGLFLKRGENILAAEVAGEGAELFPGLPLLAYRRALSLARSGGTARAHGVLREQWEAVSRLSDARPLLGRLYKDAWKASGNQEDLLRARDEYAEAAAEDRNDVYYPAVNAATLSLLAGEEPAAQRFAEIVRTDLDGRGGPSNYWEMASLAEAQLCAGDVASARESYHRAVSMGVGRAEILTTRDQAVLLLDKLGHPRNELDDVFGQPRVVIVTGHRIDAPGRATPRFPVGRSDSVQTRLRTFLANFAPWAGFAGAADGSDLLGLEILHELGASTTVVLPFERGQFRAVSVAASWNDRFDAALGAAAHVRESRYQPDVPGVWEFGNEMILGNAVRRATEWSAEIVLLAVWDGQAGDGAGGTAHMVSRATSFNVPVWTINPLDDHPAELHHPVSAPLNRALGFCVHVTGTSGDASGPWTDTAVESVELEPELRLIYPSDEQALEAAHSLRQRWPSAGIGLSTGPSTQPRPGSQYFCSQAAALARRATRFAGTLTSPEFVAATSPKRAASFEPAGSVPLGSNSTAAFACAIGRGGGPVE